MWLIEGWTWGALSVWGASEVAAEPIGKVVSMVDTVVALWKCAYIFCLYHSCFRETVGGYMTYV